MKNSFYQVSLLAACFIAIISDDAMAQPQVTDDCGSPFYNGQVGPYDYENSSHRTKQIKTVESHHFNADVQNLVKGQSSAYIMADLDFILRAVPNHHLALATLLRYAPMRQTQEKQFFDTECYFQRAIVFRPMDATAHVLYGVYLARNGMIGEAKDMYVTALNLRPNYAEAHYNLGLVYVKQKDFERALESERKARELGYPLQGLRRQLERAGAWRDE